jgi:hypothetical protein
VPTRVATSYVVRTRVVQSYSKEVQFLPSCCAQRVTYLVIGISDLELESTFLEHLHVLAKLLYSNNMVIMHAIIDSHEDEYASATKGQKSNYVWTCVVFIIRQGQAYCAALFDLQGFLNLRHTENCPIESFVASGYRIRSGFPVFT